MMTITIISIGPEYVTHEIRTPSTGSCSKPLLNFFKPQLVVSSEKEAATPTHQAYQKHVELYDTYYILQLKYCICIAPGISHS